MVSPTQWIRLTELSAQLCHDKFSQYINENYTKNLTGEIHLVQNRIFCLLFFLVSHTSTVIIITNYTVCFCSVFAIFDSIRIRIETKYLLLDVYFIMYAVCSRFDPLFIFIFFASSSHRLKSLTNLTRIARRYLQFVVRLHQIRAQIMLNRCIFFY